MQDKSSLCFFLEVPRDQLYGFEYSTRANRNAKPTKELLGAFLMVLIKRHTRLRHSMHNTKWMNSSSCSVIMGSPNAELCGNFGTAQRWKNCPATAPCYEWRISNLIPMSAVCCGHMHSLSFANSLEEPHFTNQRRRPVFKYCCQCTNFESICASLNGKLLGALPTQ
jgi:hypothetical protein